MTATVLRRWWIEFDRDDLPAAVGVTAGTLEEALTMVGSHYEVGPAVTLALKRVEVDIDVSSLPDWMHHQIGVPVRRGLWYPVSALEP